LDAHLRNEELLAMLTSVMEEDEDEGRNPVVSNLLGKFPRFRLLTMVELPPPRTRWKALLLKPLLLKPLLSPLQPREA
jgi:hypothetical protein